MYRELKDALPLIGIGVAGGAVYAMNHRPFTWKNFTERLITAGFMSSVTLMLLSSTDFCRTVQGGICGVVGALSIEILEAVRIRVIKEITGEKPIPHMRRSDHIENKENEAD